MQELPSHPSPSDILLLLWLALFVSRHKHKVFPVPYLHTRLPSKVTPKVRLDLRSLLSSWLCPHPSTFFLYPRLGSQLCLDLNRTTVWSHRKNRWQANGWEGWKEGCGTSEEAASCEEAAFLRWGCICVAVCVCLLVLPSLCAWSQDLW